MEQLTFDFTQFTVVPENDFMNIETAVKEVQKKAGIQANNEVKTSFEKKPEIPEYLLKLERKLKDGRNDAVHFIKTMAEYLNIDESKIMIRKSYTYYLLKQNLYLSGINSYDIRRIPGGISNYYIIHCSDKNFNIVEIFEGNAFMLKITMEKMDHKDSHVFCMKYGTWQICKKLIPDMNFLTSTENMNKEMEKYLPYASDIIRENGYHPEYFIIAPQLEQLYKAGYKEFVDEVEYCLKQDVYRRAKYTGLDYFNRLTQPGKNLKEIFKTNKVVYTTLKGCKDLRIWDMYRKLMKQRTISKETFEHIVAQGFNQKQLDKVYQILGRMHRGHPVFTFDSLNRYLDRLNMYEAVGMDEALQLINDYLRMCEQLKMQPRIDGDSLKREHDVTARILREKYDEIMEKKMNGACEHLKKYNYDKEGEIYFIRGIRDYNDLIDEAKQQHNCVAGYASSIIAKRSYVYVMREKRHPEKSLITIELSPDGHTIRQKYLAYNHQIRNASQSEFIKRWHKWVKEGGNERPA